MSLAVAQAHHHWTACASPSGPWLRCASRRSWYRQLHTLVFLEPAIHSTPFFVCRLETCLAWFVLSMLLRSAACLLRLRYLSRCTARIALILLLTSMLIVPSSYPSHPLHDQATRGSYQWAASHSPTGAYASQFHVVVMLLALAGLSWRWLLLFCPPPPACYWVCHQGSVCCSIFLSLLDELQSGVPDTLVEQGLEFWWARLSRTELFTKVAVWWSKSCSLFR